MQRCAVSPGFTFAPIPPRTLFPNRVNPPPHRPPVIEFPEHRRQGDHPPVCVRSKNRLALANARKSLDRADTALGRHAWRELLGDEAGDIREAFANLHRLDEEVEAAHLRIAEIETAVREKETEREVARRDHSQALAAIDEEREPFHERLATLQAALAERGKVLHDQNDRKNALNAAQTALLKARPPRPPPESPAHRLGTRRAPGVSSRPSAPDSPRTRRNWQRHARKPSSR